MNRAETHDLLTFIAAYDNRRFDDATVLAWHPIVEELPFVDCRRAVVDHFRNTEAYLMPVHVRRGALELERDRKRVQREAVEREERLAIEADPTRRDRSEATRELIAQLRDSLPDGDPDKLRRVEWLEHDRRRERLANAEPNPEVRPYGRARDRSQGGSRMITPTDHSECAVWLKGKMAKLGADVFVTTAAPLIRTQYDQDPFTCPHGTTYWLAPTSEQIAEWAKDGVR